VSTPQLLAPDRATFAAARTVPFSRPSIRDEEIEEVGRCLLSGWITSGPDEAFADVADVGRLGPVTYLHPHAHHLYPVRVESERLTTDRDPFATELRALGTGVGFHFTAVHELTYSRRHLGEFSAELPVATAASRSLLSPPLFPSLDKEDQDNVIDCVRRIDRARRR